MKATTSSSFSSQSEGLAERVNRILVENAGVMLDDSSLLLKNVCRTIRLAIIRHNLTVTVELGGKAPTKVLFGTVPYHYKLALFGCAAFVHNHKNDRRDKLEGRDKKRTYLGNERGCT